MTVIAATPQELESEVSLWMPATNSVPMIAHSRVNPNGRVVIPVAMREKMGLKANDVVVMTLENGVLRIQSHHEVIRGIQGYFKQFSKPGVLASNELIEERRAEAQRELEELV